MSAHAAINLIGVGLELAAGGLAIPGWLTNRPDGSERFQYRLLSMLCLFPGYVLALYRPHSWWEWAGLLVGGAYFLSRAGFWFRATEKARKAERQIGGYFPRPTPEERAAAPVSYRKRPGGGSGG